MQGLEIENVIDSAKQAAKDGMLFCEYVGLIFNIIGSGQSYEEVKAIFIKHGINLYFEGFADGQKCAQTTNEDGEI